MIRVNDEKIDFILDDFQKNGITIERLRENLLDHICILIENNLEEGADFEKFYYSAIKSFYKKELRELEEEALFLEKNKGPHVLLTRNTFFILLFTIFIGPYILYDLLWFLNEGRASVLPFEIWASTLVFACFPLLVLFVLFTTPENLDPIIPRKSKILLGIKPFIRIVPDERRM